MKEKGLKITVNNILLVLFCLYFILKPIYIFDSGLPQIADFILVTLYTIMFFSSKDYVVEKNERTIINKKFQIAFIFLIWVFLINILWAIQLSSVSILKPTIFYLFNILAMHITKELYYRNGKQIILKISKYVMYSCLIQFILSFTLPKSMLRSTVFFNNPNQLGLYALIVLTYIIILKDNYKPIYFIIGIVCSCYLILISLSKAAIIGAIALMTIFLIKLLKKNIYKIIFAFCVITFVILGGFDYAYSKIQKVEVMNVAINRINLKNMSQENDSNLIDGRGYGRIKEIGYKVIYGVGEGEFYRFQYLNGVEVHSGFASIICYYGIIGFALLLLFIFKVIPFGESKYLYMSGVFLYALTHQIWRNTLIWMLFIVMLVISKSNTRGKPDEKNL